MFFFKVKLNIIIYTIQISFIWYELL